MIARRMRLVVLTFMRLEELKSGACASHPHLSDRKPIYTSATHGRGRHKLTLSLADHVHSLESMQHLSRSLGAAVGPTGYGINVHATCALEQSRRSAPVNSHVVWHHHGIMYPENRSQPSYGVGVVPVFRLRAMSPYYPIWDILKCVGDLI